MFRKLFKRTARPQTPEPINEKKLDDFLDEYSCTRNLNKISTKIEITYDYIVRNQPIGKLLFQSFCLLEFPEYHDFIKLMAFAENNKIVTEEEKKLYKNRLKLLLLKQNVNDDKSLGAVLYKAMRNKLSSKKSTDENKTTNYMEAAHEYLAQNAFHKFLTSIYYQRYLQFKSLEMNCCKENSFIFENHLSCGAFSEVCVCQSKLTKTKFACKQFNKARSAVKNQTNSIEKEKEILQKIKSPFVLDLYCTFETEKSICMVLTLMSAGDLKYHLKHETDFYGFSTQRAQFYAAEITCGILYLHSKNIVHFDLKPSNILMDHKGHIRIGDFGLARIIEENQKLKRRLGSKLYMAPEVIRKENVSSAVDWFSFGCIVYEMIAGKNPFMILSDKLQIYNPKELILDKEVSYGNKFTENAEHLCSKLLDKDPESRMSLTTINSDWADEIKKNKFFNGINWTILESGNAEPPFKPKDGKSYFDKRKQSPLLNDLNNWSPSTENRDFYKSFCSGAESFNWQNDVIDSKCFHQLNVYY